MTQVHRPTESRVKKKFALAGRGKAQGRSSLPPTVNYQGYWYRPVVGSTVRVRVWEPDGTLLCMCSVEAARQEIDRLTAPVQYQLSLGVAA